MSIGEFLYWGRNMSINELVGKTLTSIVRDENEESLTFHTTDGERFLMFHIQDCCESVRIEDICGDLEDLIGSPILTARENVSSNEDPEGEDEREEDWRESFTWTFYDLATAKGAVTIRWYGESNGYYSERVTFTKMEDEGEDN